MQLIKSELPIGGEVYTPRRPFMARTVANEVLIEDGGLGDVRKITLDLAGSGIRYLEGQSVGVVAPGTDAEGKPHRPRLYSIASAVEESPEQVTLCVKRVHHRDPETGAEVRGVASNLLCDLEPGDEVALTGPAGRRFLLPAANDTDLILIAAGVGVAPFRAFLQGISRRHEQWRGEVHFFFGTRSGKEALCLNRVNNELGGIFEADSWKLYTALSKGEAEAEAMTRRVGAHLHATRGYVQDQLRANIEELWPVLRRGNFGLYLCGMKGMEEGVTEVVRERIRAEGGDAEALIAQWKAEGRWNIEVY
jgi:ferredoxin--NADP+ reductase